MSKAKRSLIVVMLIAILASACTNAVTGTVTRSEGTYTFSYTTTEVALGLKALTQFVTGEKVSIISCNPGYSCEMKGNSMGPVLEVRKK